MPDAPSIAELVARLDRPAGLAEAEAQLVALRAEQAKLVDQAGVIRRNGRQPGEVIDVSPGEFRRGRVALARLLEEQAELGARIDEQRAVIARGRARHVAAITLATGAASADALENIRCGIELIMSGVTVHEQIAKAVLAAGGNQLPAPPAAQVRPRLMAALGIGLADRLGGRNAA